MIHFNFAISLFAFFLLLCCLSVGGCIFVHIFATLTTACFSDLRGSVCQLFLSSCHYLCLSVCLSVGLYFCLYANMPFSVCLFVYVSVCLSFCLCASMSVCLSVCLSVNTYISYTRHYYDLQYVRNQQVLRQINPRGP